MCSELWELKETCLVDKSYFCNEIFFTLKILPFFPPPYIKNVCLRVSSVLWIIYYALSFSQASIFREISHLRDDIFEKNYFLLHLWCYLFYPSPNTPLFSLQFFFFFHLRELARLLSNSVLKLLALAWPSLVFCMTMNVNRPAISSLWLNVTAFTPHTWFSNPIVHTPLKTNLPN